MEAFGSSVLEPPQKRLTVKVTSATAFRFYRAASSGSDLSAGVGVDISVLAVTPSPLILSVGSFLCTF